MRNIKSFFEYILFMGFLGILYIIGRKRSQKLCANIMAFAGRFTSANRTAKSNLQHAFPEKSEKEINELTHDVWKHFGSVMGSSPFLSKMSLEELEKIVYISPKNKKLINKLHERKTGVIICSAHYGNWEVGAQIFAKNNFSVNAVYRELNNKLLDEKVNMFRGQVKMINKGTQGSREIIKRLKNKEIITILTDQRLTAGIKIPFFNRPVYTAPAIATLALKFGVPILPVRVKKLKDKKSPYEFEFEICPEIKVKDTGNVQVDTENIMIQVNQLFEKWITETPEQWFWVHDRWKL